MAVVESFKYLDVDVEILSYPNGIFAARILGKGYDFEPFGQGTIEQARGIAKARIEYTEDKYPPRD
jgi:hypothetical protein